MATSQRLADVAEYPEWEVKIWRHRFVTDELEATRPTLVTSQLAQLEQRLAVFMLEWGTRHGGIGGAVPTRRSLELNFYERAVHRPDDPLAKPRPSRLSLAEEVAMQQAAMAAALGVPCQQDQQEQSAGSGSPP